VHSIIDGDHLRTRFAYAPRVNLEAKQEGPMTVEMRFPSSALDVDGQLSITTITFTDVLDFRWSDFELGLARANPRDTGFRLIEITDSALVGEFHREGKIRDRPCGVIQLEDLHHFRIGFDDHGSYDIVCAGMSFSVAGEAAWVA